MRNASWKRASSFAKKNLRLIEWTKMATLYRAARCRYLSKTDEPSNKYEYKRERLLERERINFSASLEHAKRFDAGIREINLRRDKGPAPAKVDEACYQKTSSVERMRKKTRRFNSLRGCPQLMTSMHSMDVQNHLSNTILSFAHLISTSAPMYTNRNICGTSGHLL